ncbi:efflux RND transporter periplasmic adaptor subunit [Parabacteroides sp. AF17-28]|uniref:efflux RND transporter periplasmic adaptor subunit n=1 Tax=Parabacteroides sp. AF17-28 TaxID=2292241 RepID=UPI000EFFBA81|nr:efflux RND transporter periplasmic adaptor subunit [Parabacteroides sp. AF17-28]RHR53333.1 efflux RND transporter periplasmic adaptor subunit [Parabacteroides sp. AF17-28]
MKIRLNPVLLVGIALLFVSCKDKDIKKEQGIEVNTARVSSVSMDGDTEFAFIAQPFRTSELSFRVSGPVDQFDVYTGNRYRRGSIIAGIDPRDFRIRRNRAEAVFLQAKAEYERIQVLFEKENVAASVYEKAKADYASAKAAFETAVNELEDTKLLAPFDGYVGEVYLEKFQDVKASQPVISFIDIDRLKIEVYVTQDIACSIQPRDTIRLRFDTQPDQIYKAGVVEISKGTTRNNLSYLLTAILPNEDNRLLSGMSGKAFLKSAPVVSGNITIPQAALCHRPSVGDYVWVVNPETNRVARQSVTVGELLPDGTVRIEEGLQKDEVVATSGLRFLSDGMDVSISERGKR